jgi:small subunit ribosomal protein S7
MPRRKRPQKRELLPDPKFNDLLVAQFINNILRQGKKSLAERVFYDAIRLVQEKTKEDGLAVFRQAVNNVKPLLEVKPRRVGGATYQVPVEIRPERRIALVIRWLIGFAQARSEHTMQEKLAAEFIAASRNEGNAIKKKEDTHKMAEANKAFAHFRW